MHLVNNSSQNQVTVSGASCVKKSIDYIQFTSKTVAKVAGAVLVISLSIFASVVTAAIIIPYEFAQVAAITFLIVGTGFWGALGICCFSGIYGGLLVAISALALWAISSLTSYIYNKLI